MHFLFTISHNYAPHMAATIVSILKSQDRAYPLVFHVIHSGLGYMTKRKIAKLRNIRPFSIYYYGGKDWTKDFPLTIKHTSVETYYRLFAPRVYREHRESYPFRCRCYCSEGFG